MTRNVLRRSLGAVLARREARRREDKAVIRIEKSLAATDKLLLRRLGDLRREVQAQNLARGPR